MACPCKNKQKLPPVTTQIANAASAVGRVVKAVIKNEQIIAAESLCNERIEACKQCRRYIRRSGRCMECGCFVKPKASLLTEKCPKNRWKR